MQVSSRIVYTANTGVRHGCGQDLLSSEALPVSESRFPDLRSQLYLSFSPAPRLPAASSWQWLYKISLPLTVTGSFRTST